jgi:hypothetical protein
MTDERLAELERLAAAYHEAERVRNAAAAAVKAAGLPGGPGDPLWEAYRAAELDADWAATEWDWELGASGEELIAEVRRLRASNPACGDWPGDDDDILVPSRALALRQFVERGDRMDAAEIAKVRVSVRAMLAEFERLIAGRAGR